MHLKRFALPLAHSSRATRVHALLAAATLADPRRAESVAQGAPSPRERRLAEREAILSTRSRLSAEIVPSGIGAMDLDAKCAGARSAGNPHVTCDETGAGNGLTDRLAGHSQRKRGATDRPILRGTAPAPDPTSALGEGQAHPRRKSSIVTSLISPSEIMTRASMGSNPKAKTRTRYEPGAKALAESAASFGIIPVDQENSSPRFT